MAHFAKLGVNGKVIAVLTLDNKDMLNGDNVEDETVGQQYLELHNNWPAQMWVQTSYNTRGNKHSSGDNTKAFRGNYAGIGYLWDEENQIFWPPKQYPSWVKNTTTANWESPIGPKPELTEEQKTQNIAPEGVDEEGNPNKSSHAWHYLWNETNQTWDLIDGYAE